MISSNIETVNIREDLLDLVVRLADDSLGHFEFQSTREPTPFRFFLYGVHLFFNLQRPIRTFVLYTAPTNQAPEVLEAGVMTYRVQNVLIYQRDGKVAYQRLQNHLESGIWGLDDEWNTASLVFMRGGPDATSKRHTAAMVYGLAPVQMNEEQQLKLEVKGGVFNADLLETSNLNQIGFWGTRE
ncbi:hypothetical protein D2Q93_06230 [Alicyclobacillaceae bacterium I2511]|nr:hypothetical protein D2Q93_06230 [Alicyclobacillaceae bacterium I2511]